MAKSTSFLLLCQGHTSLLGGLDMDSEQEQLMKILVAQGQSSEEAQEILRQLTCSGTCGNHDLPHRSYFESWFSLESADRTSESTDWS